MNQILLFLISYAILVISIKIGFALTKSYIDIKAVIIVILISQLANIITSHFGLIGTILNSVLTYYLLYKLGGTDPWPDTVLALAVGKGLFFVTMMLLSTSLLHLKLI